MTGYAWFALLMFTVSVFVALKQVTSRLRELEDDLAVHKNYLRNLPCVSRGVVAGLPYRVPSSPTGCALPDVVANQCAACGGEASVLVGSSYDDPSPSYLLCSECAKKRG